MQRSNDVRLDLHNVHTSTHKEIINNNLLDAIQARIDNLSVAISTLEERLQTKMNKKKRKSCGRKLKQLRLDMELDERTKEELLSLYGAKEKIASDAALIRSQSVLLAQQTDALTRIRRESKMASAQAEEVYSLSAQELDERMLNHNEKYEEVLTNISDIKPKYDKMHALGGCFTSFLGWISQRQLRNRPLDHPRVVQMNTISALIAELEKPVRINQLINLGIEYKLSYFKADNTDVPLDTAKMSARELRKREHEQKEALRLVKSLVLYGALRDIETQISRENNIAPSRLAEQIIKAKAKLRGSIELFSDAVFKSGNKDSWVKISDGVYNKFITEMLHAEEYHNLSKNWHRMSNRPG